MLRVLLCLLPPKKKKKKEEEEMKKDVESLGLEPFWKCERKYKEAKRIIVEGRDRFGQN